MSLLKTAMLPALFDRLELRGRRMAEIETADAVHVARHRHLSRLKSIQNQTLKTVS
ncbi:MAG: hypothetical protein ABJB17_11935 [Burkholderiales bacterium]